MPLLQAEISLQATKDGEKAPEGAGLLSWVQVYIHTYCFPSQAFSNSHSYSHLQDAPGFSRIFPAHPRIRCFSRGPNATHWRPRSRPGASASETRVRVLLWALPPGRVSSSGAVDCCLLLGFRDRVALCALAQPPAPPPRRCDPASQLGLIRFFPRRVV